MAPKAGDDKKPDPSPEDQARAALFKAIAEKANGADPDALKTLAEAYSLIGEFDGYG
jgi:hypothetical protein